MRLGRGTRSRHVGNPLPRDVSLRILMVSQFYPPVAGGEEQHVRNLSSALAERGHEVSVATIRLDGDDPSPFDGTVRIHRLSTSVQRVDSLFSSSRPFAPPFPDPKAVAELRRIVRAERPDVIHGHNWLARSIVPRMVRGDRPLVMTLHDYGLVCAKKRFVHRGTRCSGPGPVKCLLCASGHYGTRKGVPVTFTNWASARAERRAVKMYVPVSASVAESNQLQRRGLPFRVIPNFVADDLADRPDVRDPALERIPSRDFILFAGDMSRDKGVEVLLAAYEQLDRPPPLVFIGRPIVPLGDLPHNVFVLGVVPAPVVMAAWRRSMLGVVPSIVPDACPTVILEAMATGRPVIGARSGGIPDLVADEETGLLVPPGDPAALATALQRLLSSPDLRLRMGRAARTRLREFTASSVVPRVEDVYREVLPAGRDSLGRSGRRPRRRMRP